MATKTKNRYAELRNRQQKEFDELPISAAFSNEQFKKMMEGWGLTEDDTDKIYHIGFGAYIQKKDAEKLHETTKRHNEEMEAAIAADETGEGFIYEMFLYELDNHEYGYTGELEDTLDAIGYTLNEVNANKALNAGMLKAVREIQDREW